MIEESDGTIVVRDLDRPISWAYRSAVAKIVYHGGERRDVFTNKTSIASEIHGGIGNDLLTGGSGHDTIYGDGGHDDLYGGAGQDVLDGGADSDLLYGEGDDDHLVHSESSSSYLRGGGGDDTYVFKTSQSHGVARIDWVDRDDSGRDTLDFSGTSEGIKLDLRKVGELQNVTHNLTLLAEHDSFMLPCS